MSRTCRSPISPATPPASASRRSAISRCDEKCQCHARVSGHPDLAARAAALDSRLRGNDKVKGPHFERRRLLAAWPLADRRRNPCRNDNRLTRSRLPTQLLEQGAQRIEFGAETAPVSGLQPLYRPIIVRERVAGALIGWAPRRGPRGRPR